MGSSCYGTGLGVERQWYEVLLWSFHLMRMMTDTAVPASRILDQRAVDLRMQHRNVAKHHHGIASSNSSTNLFSSQPKPSARPIHRIRCSIASKFCSSLNNIIAITIIAIVLMRVIAVYRDLVVGNLS